MKILIIGGNGYLGSHLYKKLISTHDIDSIDLCLFGEDLGYSQKINYNQLHDIENYHVIICLAGHSSVRMAEYNSKNSWVNNVEYFRNLCDKLHTNQILIYASSASVYGTNKLISTETDPINVTPINNYDLQKITIDLIANMYINNGKKIIGLRLGTVNGPSINTRSDLMINAMIKSAIETGKIYAKNLAIRRAILDIKDFGKTIASILEKKLIPSGQYNVSSFNATVGEMAIIVSSELNAELIILDNDFVAYDFELSTEKINSILDLNSTSSVTSIVLDMKTEYNSINFNERNNEGDYEYFI